MAALKASSSICFVTLLCLLLLMAPAAANTVSLAPAPSAEETSKALALKCHEECVSAYWKFYCNLKCYHSVFDQSDEAKETASPSPRSSPRIWL